MCPSTETPEFGRYTEDLHANETKEEAPVVTDMAS